MSTRELIGDECELSLLGGNTEDASYQLTINASRRRACEHGTSIRMKNGFELDRES